MLCTLCLMPAMSRLPLQELQADRPVMQQDALQLRQTQTMLNKLGALQQLARQARLATWSCILGCEVSFALHFC